MATCKECIHKRVCFALIKTGLPYVDDKYPAEAFCITFKSTADVAEVKHGEWKLCGDAFGNDVEYHRCSVCKSEAIFECIYQPIYDENYDGEMEYIAEEFAGINEFLTDYCPNCGAKMDGGDE